MKDTNPSAGAVPEYVVVKPDDAAFLEDRAAADLAKYVQIITGRQARIVSDREITVPSSACTYFLIGPPERNKLAERIEAEGLFKRLGELPSHPDAFAMVDAEAAGARLLLLAGRRPIGTLYAVYEYLQRCCNAGFFQDGERIPRLECLPIAECGWVSAPRFDDRMHFCWNAHRAIKKYHSFWWTLEDWKREFDWMVKRRLNMLRLDMFYYSRFAGDAFQQAFPEIGPEPEGVLYPRFAGWITGWGWPPEYRRELTRQILAYGRRLGIRFIYTLDYAAVPFRFKDKHPEYTYLPANQYGQSRQISPYDPNAAKVEQKHLAKIIELYGTDHLYLYTPYAEIDVGSGDLDKNLDLRIQASRGILELIANVDPEGIWVTDSWDMSSSRRWNPQRVEKYLGSFPTEKMYLYDTAAEVVPLYRKFNFWHGKRWAFGILNAFAGKETLHGNVKRLVSRVKEATACSTCRGLFMVPECTHHNIMLWDLVTYLAWQGGDVKFSGYLKEFILSRYGGEVRPQMCRAWRKIVKAVYNTSTRGLSAHVYGNKPWYQWREDVPLFTSVIPRVERALRKAEKRLPLLAEALGILLDCRSQQADNPLYVEDVVVVFLACAAECFNREAAKAYLAFKAGGEAAFRNHSNRALEILDKITDVLAVCPSYSINKTIAEACKVDGHNERLPEMIRQACVNFGYVNNDVYEQFPGQYTPKTRAYFDLLAAKLATGQKSISRKDLKGEFKRITDAYRQAGWSGQSQVGDPVARVADCFEMLAG